MILWLREMDVMPKYRHWYVYESNKITNADLNQLRKASGKPIN